MPSANWNYPTTVRFGPGRLRELPRELAALGIQRPLVVTDPGVAALPWMSNLRSLLEEAGVGVHVFTGLRPNPTGACVEAGLAAYRQAQADGVIALGGGAALDTGKAVALMTGQTRPLFDFEDREDWWTRVDPSGVAPVVAIPTTAGTGSEVGRASVILDTSIKVKKIIFHPKMLPARVICDPELTVGLPPALTAATGMDALSHNLEAYCAPGFHPLADGVAVEGMRLIHRSLRRAVQDGQDLAARSDLLAASLMGATAFQKGLGAMHAMAHPIGAWTDAHHGLINAVVMPYVLQRNLPVIAERLDRLAAYLGLPGGAPGFIDWVLALRADLKIPHTLGPLGVRPEAVEGLSAQAVEDPSAGGNPVPLDAAGYAALLRAALAG